MIFVHHYSTLGVILDIIAYRDICLHMRYFSRYQISNSCVILYLRGTSLTN